MKEEVNMLERLVKQINPLEAKGFILGKEWIAYKRGTLKKCLITSRVTRKAILKAAQENVELIISIIPPVLTNEFEQKITDTELELLKILLDNKIAIFSLSEKWMEIDDGGLDYFLDLINFQYKQAYNLQFISRSGKKKKITGRIGERKKAIILSDLLQMLSQIVESDFRYLGYGEQPIQRLAVIEEIDDERMLLRIKEALNCDIIIVGDIAFASLVACQQIKFPIIIISKRILENITLGQLRRKLMEEKVFDLPEIITLKQDEIGTLHKH